MKTARLRRESSKRLRDERGFSLIEVLTAELIGGFVITAAISMLVIAFNSSARVTDRINSAQQGRIAMEQIQQRLRSQTCLFAQEYVLNTNANAALPTISFLHAGPSKMVFFSDVGAVTSTVRFHPEIRYIYVDQGPTTGKEAGRRATFVEGFRRSPSTNIPFRFSILPATSLTDLATVSTLNGVNPTIERAFAEGVTNEVSGATSIPIFRYFDFAGAELTPVSGSLPAASLTSINKVEVTFRVLGFSGKDQVGGANSPIDRRTAAFKNEIYLRTQQQSCN